MQRIESIKARQILDSRGNPTIEVEVKTKNAIGRASAPSGASRGSKEAVELRDGGKEFHGKGVNKAIENVNTIVAPAVAGMDVYEQEKIDEKIIKIDGTPDKRIIGGNACIATSIACCKCAANSKKIPAYLYLNKDANLLPIPFMNIINGGKHAGNELAVQEFMIVPIMAKSFSNAIRMACEVYYSLKEIILKMYGRNAINV
ncbi:MAG: phosphopyruvate hydratase, partial [Candidatus Thermoplasmatota archaeon]